MPDPRGPLPRALAPDVAAVDAFSMRMKSKLRANAHKAHWSTVTQSWLFARLRDEMAELAFAMRSEGPEAIASECADVANFAMMIADNAVGKEPPP